MPSKLIEVKAHCHQCDKFRVRAGYDDIYDTDDLVDTAVAELQDVDQCPHSKGEMEITTVMTRKKGAARRKSKFHV